MNEPFDVWFKRQNPDKCQVCLGQGTLVMKGRWVERLVFPCTPCKGTGLSDLPLFTAEGKGPT